MSEMICALDVGTTKVCALIGDFDENGALRVVGFGRTPSRGLRRGVVVNTAEAKATITQAIQQAEAAAGPEVSLEAAYVGITGAHVTTVGNKGVIAVGRNGRKITREDTLKALEQARNIALPHNREIINAVPRSYMVDNENGILDPVGMFAYRLEVDANIITGATSAVANLVNCVLDSGVEIRDLVLQPLASAEAVLTDEERRAGVALVDIGGGTTDLAIYFESAAWHTFVLDIGGDHFTRDVSTILRMPYDKAEALIRQFGHAVPDQVPSDSEVRARRFGEDSQQIVNRRLLAEILKARAEEVTDLIYTEIKRSGYDGMLPAGVVLTGGVSQLPGLTEVSRTVLDWPVRLGRPPRLNGGAAELTSPEYSTAVGLLQWGLRQGGTPRVPMSQTSTTTKRVLEFVRRLLPIPIS